MSSAVPMSNVDELNNLPNIHQNLLEQTLNLERRKWLLFKKKLTITDLLLYTRPFEAITRAARNQDDFLRKLEVVYNNIIGVEKDSPLNTGNLTQLNDLLHAGLFLKAGQLRDEMYWQCLKQLHSNPSEVQKKRAWRLMCCLTAAFPPSKALFPWLKDQLSKAATNEPAFYACCESNLAVFGITGPRGYSTTLHDVQFWFNEAASVPRLFGVALESIYAQPSLIDPSLNHLPFILIRLTRMITLLGGHEREGIFRVSGDLQQVFQLKNLFSMPQMNIDFGDLQGDDCCQVLKSIIVRAGDYTLNVHDAAVPSSLLKLWLRTLQSPLLPDSLYSRLISARKEPDTVRFLLRDELPLPNHNILQHLLRFLLHLAQEHQAATKMDLENFGMIFAPCLMRCPLQASPLQILQQSSQERELMRTLFDIHK